MKRKTSIAFSLAERSKPFVQEELKSYALLAQSSGQQLQPEECTEHKPSDEKRIVHSDEKRIVHKVLQKVRRKC